MLEAPLTILALALAGGYLLGSIPFGLVLTSSAGLGDVRKIGSGNIGATNVLRTGRKDLAALTLILDGAKGAVAVLLAAHFLGPQAALVAALGAFLGHLFPVWLRFKGGKGVATFIGVELALAWPVGLLICATWALTAAALRMSSAAALVAAALTPLFALWLVGWQHAVLSAVLAVLIFIRHHENIRRLIAGTEPKIGGSKKSSHAS